MDLLLELCQLNEAVKMREDGIYKHSSQMCEVHVDANDPEDGVRARVIFKSVDYDDEDQIEMSRHKYLKFVTDVLHAYGLDVNDAHTDEAEDDGNGNAQILLEFPPEDLE